MSDEKRLYELGQQKADSTEGVCVDVAWASRTALVNANGIEGNYPWTGAPPWPGDRVRLVKAGVGNVFCELIQGAPMGTVITSASRVATVSGDDGVTYRYPYLGGAPANGARVRLDHVGRCVLGGSYSTEPDGSDVAPVPEPTTVPPPPPVVGGSATFAPVWSGSWRYGNLAGPAVESSYTRVAGVGFGWQIVGSIPAGATVTKAELLLVQEWNRSGSPAPIRFGVHGHDGQPGTLAEGDLSGVVAVPQSAGRYDIGAFAAALRSGAAKGLGIYPDEAYWIRYAAAPTGVRVYMEWR